MKVHVLPTYEKPDKGEGGIRRVVEAQFRYLPEYGVQFVNTAQEADLVNCHATTGAKHDTVVHSLHGLYWHGYSWGNWAHQANRQLINTMLHPNTRAITSPSEWVSNSVRRGMLISPRTVYHGIDIEEWVPAGSQEPYVVWGKTRVDPVCDPAPLNRLAAKATGVRFVTTFGDKNLQNVEVVGKLPLPEFRKILQGGSIYLATVRETGGITVLEAMASGVVPLGYRWGVNPEIIEHKETGYLVEPNDDEALLEGLIYIRQNWARMRDAARQAVVERFQWKDVVYGYVEAYRDALDKPEGPCVSVIVTAYNLDQYLPACLDSVLSQDYEDWELIIVDDHSPDRCGEIADAYSSRDNRIKVLHNPKNVYLAEARNIGIRHSRGRYILPLDADDRLGEGALGILARSLDQDTNLDIVTGAMMYNEGEVWKVSGWPIANPSFRLQIQEKNMVPYASMYRRWVWERTGGYRRRCRTAEDAEFWTRAMSFGANPGKVTEKPTLIYLNRPESMSHQEPATNWTSWFTWADVPELTPYAAAPTDPRTITHPVRSYDPPMVSIIIPCGPGHTVYLQDALDSLVGQTFTDWEVIVVNDTGVRWLNDAGEVINPYLQGYPFVRIVDSAEVKGVAKSRNLGISQARSPVFILLDADDYAQPAMVEILYHTWKRLRGWVYCDCYDQHGQVKQVLEWNPEMLIQKMLGPSTGIYSVEEWKLVGGFDENAPGWEDWDFQLALFKRGSCGSRVPLPLFTYRYDTGSRREADFSNASLLVQYIHNKHYQICRKDQEGQELFMGCRKCPRGGGSTGVTVRTQTIAERNARIADTDMVEIRYVGPQEQTRRVRSKVNPSRSYRFGGQERNIFVYAKDAGWLTMLKDFELVPQQPVESTTVDISDLSTIRAERTVESVVEQFVEAPPPQPVSVLELDGRLETILKNNGFHTVESIPHNLADLVAIKGIGTRSAEQILEALDAV